MARVPITVMGFQCERCGHQWIPRDIDLEPRHCPKCKSPYWNRPRKGGPLTSYEAFRDRVRRTLREAAHPLTWTDIRTKAGLPQSFPNNQWVRRLEEDISLIREKDAHGIIHWSLAGGESHDTTERTSTSKRASARPARPEGSVES